ncbi:cohesin domain-containing protein [Gemmatimonadota bacterium]
MTRLARRLQMPLLLAAILGFTMILPACDAFIPPLVDAELENPIDPESPDTFVEPETTITGGPTEGSTITSPSTTFSFSSNADLYQWSLLGTTWDGAWSAWSEVSSLTLEYLNEGSYSFLVRSAYAPGEGAPTSIDPTPASLSFSVDAVAGPSLRLSPLLISSSVGEEVLIEIVAEEVTGLMAVKAVIHYDPGKLTVEELLKGDFLASTGGSVAAYFDIDDLGGAIEINIGTATGTPVGVSGTGTIAHLRCTISAAIDQDLTFDQALTEFRDADNQPIAIVSLIGARVRSQ